MSIDTLKIKNILYNMHKLKAYKCIKYTYFKKQDQVWLESIVLLVQEEREAVKIVKNFHYL